MILNSFPFWLGGKTVLRYKTPVQDKHKSSEECYQKAEVTVAPDPDREGEEHAPDGGDVRETV